MFRLLKVTAFLGLLLLGVYFLVIVPFFHWWHNPELTYMQVTQINIGSEIVGLVLFMTALWFGDKM